MEEIVDPLIPQVDLTLAMTIRSFKLVYMQLFMSCYIVFVCWKWRGCCVCVSHRYWKVGQSIRAQEITNSCKMCSLFKRSKVYSSLSVRYELFYCRNILYVTNDSHIWRWDYIHPSVVAEYTKQNEEREKTKEE
jgi:hypothetical protein